MIGIQLDGDTEFLDTLPAAAISVRLENPVLSDADRISPGSYSYPFNLPGGDKSPNNAAKLKNPDVIENNEAYTIQKATLFCSSAPDSNVVPFKRGNLKAQESEKNMISSYFTFGLNSIDESFKKAKLRDVLNENIVISAASITKAIYIKTIQEDQEMDITVNGEAYAGDMADVVLDINDYADSQVDTDKFVPYAELIVTGTSPSTLLAAPFIKLTLVKVTSAIPGPGLDYETSVNPLDELSVRVNEFKVSLVDTLSQTAKSITQSDYLIESFDMDSYYDAFDTFFAGYISGTYPTDKFRIPALLNTDPYGALGKLEPGTNGGTVRSVGGGIVSDPQTIKTGDLINGVNASGLIRNTANSVINFLLGVAAWNSATAYTRFQSYVKYADTNGDMQYWRCQQSHTNQAPPTNPIATFNSYWVQVSLKYQVDNKNLNSLQPFLRRQWILEKIATTFNFELEGDFIDHDDFPNMLEYTTTSLDSPQDYIGTKKFVFWRRSFNLNELVPDITVVEYLRRLQVRYNLGVYYSDITKKVRMCFMEPVSKSITYSDITSLSSPIKNIDDQRITGYSLICPKDDNDGLSEQDTLSVGTVQEEIIMAMGGIKDTAIQVVDGNPITAPVVKQNFGTEYLMRTFYYTGINSDGAFDYPSASIKGTIINEQLATVGVDVGIYELFWKYWLYFKQRRLSVKLKVDFPLRSLIAFDWELKRRFNRVNYLVKAIDLTVTNQGVVVTDVELYTQQ